MLTKTILQLQKRTYSQNCYCSTANTTALYTDCWCIGYSLYCCTANFNAIVTLDKIIIVENRNLIIIAGFFTDKTPRSYATACYGASQVILCLLTSTFLQTDTGCSSSNSCVLHLCRKICTLCNSSLSLNMFCRRNDLKMI